MHACDIRPVASDIREREQCLGPFAALLAKFTDDLQGMGGGVPTTVLIEGLRQLG
jgi:hypothetical protein